MKSRRQNYIRWFLFVIFAVIALAGVGFWLRYTIKASCGYDVQANYDAMPADDKALETWIKTQPGVVEHTVLVQRDGHQLVAYFIMAQDLSGRPTFPDLDQACATLGYKGGGTWHDRQQVKYWPK
jgi:hypothetical protein